MRSSSQTQSRGRRSRRDEEEQTGFAPAWLSAGAQLAARRPLDTAGFAFATFGCLAILINALFLQSGLHPAPLIPFKPKPMAFKETTGATTGATSPADAIMPRPRPIDMSRGNAVPSPAPVPAPQALVPAAPADAKPKLEKSEVVSEISKGTGAARSL